MFIADLFKDLDIQKAVKEETANDIINKFVVAINAERKKKLPFIAIKMKLLAIKDNKELLREYYSECMDYKNRNGSFGKRFFGGLKLSTDKNTT